MTFMRGIKTNERKELIIIELLCNNYLDIEFREWYNTKGSIIVTH